MIADLNPNKKNASRPINRNGTPRKVRTPKPRPSSRPKPKNETFFGSLGKAIADNWATGIPWENR